MSSQFILFLPHPPPSGNPFVRAGIRANCPAQPHHGHAVSNSREPGLVFITGTAGGGRRFSLSRKVQPSPGSAGAISSISVYCRMPSRTRGTTTSRGAGHKASWASWASFPSACFPVSTRCHACGSMHSKSGLRCLQLCQSHRNTGVGQLVTAAQEILEFFLTRHVAQGELFTHTQFGQLCE